MLFGKKVSPAFRTRVSLLATNIGAPVDDFMLSMAQETGQTFSPSVVNEAGSGAVGLIQFMPQTAAGLGTSTRDLARMSAVDQLDYVEKFFKPWKGKLRNLGDVYMAILWPAAIGKSDTYVLFDEKTGPRAYAQNRGLDFNKDGEIMRGEAYARVRSMIPAGQQFAA